MTPDDSIGDAEPGPTGKGGEGAPAKGIEPTSLRKAILEAWAYLLLSREDVLIRLYTPLIGDRGDDLISPLTLDEARRRVEAAKRPSQLTGSARDSLESRMVLASKLTAGWTVLWTTVGPAAIVAVFCVRMFIMARARAVEPIWSRLLTVLIVAAVMFPILCVAGLAMQSVFVRPFTYALERLLFPPERKAVQGPNEGDS
jgi:hypothetical protein